MLEDSGEVVILKSDFDGDEEIMSALLMMTMNMKKNRQHIYEKN